MSDQAPNAALVRRPVNAPAELLSDDEIRRLYRVAESLALSRMFKDIARAEQAFAKMIIGRDLGLSPAQSLLGLHLVDGSVMVHYAMIGRFIEARSEEGYGYRAGWLKLEPPEPTETPADAPGWEPGQAPPRVAFVWMDEDDPTDLREIYGASVYFTTPHSARPLISTYTVEDARNAGLIKSDPRAAWNTSRRNMLLARAMSNGAKWYVPEVMAGLPLYVEGEISVDGSVTAPVGNGSDEGTGLDLGPKVEGIIARATALGHAGLSNRGALEIALGNRAPGVVTQWIKDATVELDRFEKEQEPVDAEVVEPPMPEGDAMREAAREQEMLEQLTESALIAERLKALRLLRGEEQDPEQKRLLDEEIQTLDNELRGGRS